MPTQTENQHSVANFRPEEYEVLDYLDNQRPRYVGQSIEGWEAEIRMWKEHIRRYFPTAACVTTGNVQQLPEHNIHKCRHCGQTNVRYIVAVRHTPTGTNLVFGDICVEHLGFPNYSAFRAAQNRARAAQGNANLRAYRQRMEFLETHPALKAVFETGEVTNPVHERNTFVKDIIAKFNKYGVLSERQVECFLNSLQRDHDFVQRRAQLQREDELARLTATPAAAGRQTVEGKIISVKNMDAAFGGFRWKMLVRLTTGSKVWCSIPSNLVRETANPQELREKCIRFSVTLTPKPEDPLFAWGSRPCKGAIIECPAMANEECPENDQAVQEMEKEKILDGEEV